jgi:hypothetical protein
VSFLLNVMITLFSKDSTLSALQSNYDLISWDPRGVGLALPDTCQPFGPAKMKTRSYAKINGPAGFPANFSDPDFGQLQAEDRECQRLMGASDEIGPQ